VTRVSVAIAVRDVAPYLDEALDSVLDQIGPDDEVIVVDDGSTDATPDLLAARGEVLTVVRQEPLGLSIARNLSLDHCTGELIGFVDGDDRWAPGALDLLVAALDEHPEANGAIGRTDEFLDPSVPDAAAAGLRPPEHDVFGYFLGAMLLRRSITDAVRFDPEQPMAITTDWFSRAREQGLVLHELPEITLERRLRPGSMTTDGTAYHGALLRSLRSNLARARQG
jgi:glycosyltransferase involved in cell wall biosynthesis